MILQVFFFIPSNKFCFLIESLKFRQTATAVRPGNRLVEPIPWITIIYALSQ